MTIHKNSAFISGQGPSSNLKIEEVQIVCLVRQKKIVEKLHEYLLYIKIVVFMHGTFESIKILIQ